MYYGFLGTSYYGCNIDTTTSNCVPCLDYGLLENLLKSKMMRIVSSRECNLCLDLGFSCLACITRTLCFLSCILESRMFSWFLF
jgi:hypothetical protein